jgi:hypothetical protein
MKNNDNIIEMIANSSFKHCKSNDTEIQALGYFVAGHFVAGYFVAGHLVTGHFIADRFVTLNLSIF